MEQKHNHFKFNRYVIGTLSLLVIAAAAFLLLRQNQTEATPSTKPAAKTATSQFSFSGAPGWRKGPSNKTSMALFHGPHDCFTSVEHKTGSIDVAAELQKNQDSLTSGGYTAAPGAIQSVTLQTSTGPEQYTLRQYSVTGAGSAGTVKGGQEYGYVQLPDSYVEIKGYCDTADQLSATIPALQAIKFDPAN
jgi:hypothetical protein